MVSVIHMANEYIAGAIGGIAGLIAGHPFDTTKVQIQIQPDSSRYRSIFDAALNIKQHGLVHGFFRGMSLPLFSYGFVNSVFFGSNILTTKLLVGDAKPSYQVIFYSGCTGAFAQTFPSTPAEVVKVLLQSQIPRSANSQGTVRKFLGPFEAIRSILNQKGISGLYRGFSIQLLRDVPSGGVYFLVFHYLTDTLSATSLNVHFSLIDFISGGFAGVASWLCINPLDVIKSRFQSDVYGQTYKSWMHCAHVCYREDGAQVFLRGALVTAIRAFPVNASIFMAYSYSIRKLNSLFLD